MITKNELKFYSSLTQKKYRKLEERFIAEGKKVVLEGLKSNYKCEKIFCTYNFKEENPHLFNQFLKNHFVEVLTSQDFSKLSDTVNSQEISAVFFLSRKSFEPDKKLPDKLIYLENISDPGNLGTILRICDWFGFTEVLLNESCADLYNSKTIRASAGSIFHINIYENEPIEKSIKKLKKKGYNILISDLKGESIYEYNFSGKNVIVFSNEANGPSNEILQLADDIITIPRFGSAESLNVASAAAVILSQIKKAD